MNGIASTPQPTPSWDECLEILQRLPSLPLQSRLDEVERLVRNPSPGIRDQALQIGAAILPDSRLTQFLRSDSDAVLRNAGCEIFRLRGERSLSVVLGLLRDPETDVVLQAVLILDRLGNPRALEPLHAVLGHSDPNVQQEAILAIGRLGDARSIPHLLPFLTGDPWVQIAAVQALGDLRSPEAIPHLSERLADPLVGSVAAEALAKIGGGTVFQVLAGHWRAGGAEEEEANLALLAHVVEGLPKTPGMIPEGLREALAARLCRPSAEIREAAARCLLALGVSEWDGEALDVLAEVSPMSAAASPAAGAPPAPPGIPSALSRRHDLVGRLLGSAQAEQRSWGFQLATRFPGEVPPGLFRTAVEEALEEPELVPQVARALETVRLPGLADALLASYLRLGPEGREALVPALEIHGSELRAALAWNRDVGEIDSLVLTALSGAPAPEIVERILELTLSQRLEVAGRLMSLPSVMRSLPWQRWLEEAPDLFEPIAAEAASLYQLKELLPALRARAAAAPSIHAVRALGDLADYSAVPLLLELLEKSEALRPAILESLGRIGGPDARQALCERVRTVGSGPDARMAYRALAACAGPGDDALLREAALHPDWYVRLTAVDVLARFQHPDNLTVLARLTGDPVPAVAHRALAVIAG